jgi:glycosyltransferase involved in cell wall biosynthesis
MKKLRIAQIAPLWFPVPPKKYGGTERIIHFLTEELVKRGHDVTLFASGDSKTKAELISVTKKGLISQGVPWYDWWWNNFNYSFAFEKANEFDIIHSHWTPLGFFSQNFVKTPVLHTFHNIPPKNDHRWQIFNHFKNSNVVFISKKERKNCPLRFEREFVVYNGIDLVQFKFQKEPNDHFIWIGRIEPKKGPAKAVILAKKMKLKLLLAGRLDPSQRDFFEKEIKPYLNEKIKYLGELSQNQLTFFYGRAKAFLYPLEWEEPFGLCPVESMACGTPVIAFDRGSMKEIIKNGKTGFVVKDIKEMVGAIKNIGKIKREDCREWVKKNFTIEKTVENYVKIYYQLIK